MIGITEEGKQAFLNRDDVKLYLHFEDDTILSNDDFVSGTSNLEQTLCDEEQLVYGSIGSACFSIQILKTARSYKGLRFTAYITASDGEYNIPLGTFTVTDDTLSDNRRYRALKAYDDIYMNMDKDISSWYEGLNFPLTVHEFRNSLFNYVHINQEQVSLTNDDLVVQRTIDLDEGILTFKTAIQAICEINGALGCITQYNNFRYVTPDIYNDALYPSDDLYPSNELHPKDFLNSGLFPNSNLYPSDNIYPSDPTIVSTLSTTGADSTVKQGSYVYKDYIVRPVQKVVIKENDEDYGTIYGNGRNTYEVVGNFLVYGNDNLEQAAHRLYNILNKVSYIPTKITTLGMPWVELGDYVKVVGNMGVSIFPLLHRTLKGITALVDSYEAKGTEYCATQLDGVSASIQQLKSRTLKLLTSAKEVSSELAYYEQLTDGRFIEQRSLIQQLPHSITLSVNGSLDRNTSASIVLSLYDENGHLIDSEDGNITLSGNVIFKSNLTDGQTVISGDNIITGSVSCNRIKGGTLSLGGANDIDGSITMKNANGNVIGTWDKDGLNVYQGSIYGVTISGSELISESGNYKTTIRGGEIEATVQGYRMFYLGNVVQIGGLTWFPQGHFFCSSPIIFNSSFTCSNYIATFKGIEVSSIKCGTTLEASDFKKLKDLEKLTPKIFWGSATASNVVDTVNSLISALKSTGILT